MDFFARTGRTGAGYRCGRTPRGQGGARGGRVKLGAGAPGSLPLPLPSRDDEAVVEDKKLHAGTFTGIVGLRKELDALRKAHAPCADTLQARDDQIKELKAHLARLDKKLAEELEKEEALAKELAEEKRKEAELEKTLAQEQANLKKTKAELAKDEKDLADDKKVSKQSVDTHTLHECM